jgi:sucrose-phosphate synthase
MLGVRNDMRSLDKQQKDVFQQIFELVDKYNLYGKIAYPKCHRRDQIANIYRWAADLKGLFVNPALTEPFGLTLLEAAASGLPMIATDDGGPSEILSRCRNGLLVDATDLGILQNTLEYAGSNQRQWKRWSENGIQGINQHFSWNSHVRKYLSLMNNQFNLTESQSLAEVIPLSGIKAS